MLKLLLELLANQSRRHKCHLITKKIVILTISVFYASVWIMNLEYRRKLKLREIHKTQWKSEHN